MLKSGQIEYIRNEIENIKNIAEKKLLKVVVDLDYLTKEDLEIGIVGEIKNLSNMKLFINAGIKSFNTISGVKISKEINENFWS